MVFDFQEDFVVTESRPGTSQTIPHYDPLALDNEDLYVKYKVC